MKSVKFQGVISFNNDWVSGAACTIENECRGAGVQCKIRTVDPDIAGGVRTGVAGENGGAKGQGPCHSVYG